MNKKGRRNKESCPTDTDFLDFLPDSKRVLTRTRAGTKAGVKGYLENPIAPDQAREWVRQGGNVGIKLGDVNSDYRTLCVVDVEKAGDLPDSATDVVERCTLAIFKSPHGGLNRLIHVTDDAYHGLDAAKTKIDLDNDGDHEVETLTSGHAIAPPSEINHSDCKDGKAGCCGYGADKYELVECNPDAKVMTKRDCDELCNTLGITPRKSTTETSQSQGVGRLPKIDLSNGKGDEVLRALQKKNVASFNALMSLLRGGVGPWEECLYTNGSINRSLQEFISFSLLYLSARRLARLDDDEAWQLAQNVLDRYTAKQPYTEDGQPRKWTNSPYDDYQTSQREDAFRTGDDVTFQRFLNLTSGDHESNYKKWDGLYSKVTYNITRFTIELFTEAHSVKSLSETFDEDPIEGLQDYAKYTFTLALEPEVAEYLYDRFLSIPRSPLKDVDPPISASFLEDVDHTSGEIVGSSSFNVRPTKRDVVEVALIIDNGLDENSREEDRSEGTYRQAVGDLKRWGELKMAKCYSRPNSKRYVYYKPEQPNPPDADQIEIGSEETMAKR